MLVLKRTNKQNVIKIGEDIILTIVEIGAGFVKIGIDAPKDVLILRGEITENTEGLRSE